MNESIEQVKEFWEANPLWTGESDFAPGTREFFEEHVRVVANDCFAGQIDERIFPRLGSKDRVLDLGCGPGLWTIELARRGCTSIVAADLTENALSLARRRCEIFQVAAEFSQQNAERMTFSDNTFSHVNCQGVIHHTPDTAACIREIARVLRPGGTASISVYYRNIFLQMWPFLRPVGRVLSRLGGGLKGRGREGIYAVDDVDEIVRKYDGSENPVGKSYSRRQFVSMLESSFHVENTFLHFFPARTLPFRTPLFMHRWLDRHHGFLIYASVVKR